MIKNYCISIKTLSTILAVLICFSFSQMRISKRFGYEKRSVRLTLKLERSEKEVLNIQDPQKGLYFLTGMLMSLTFQFKRLVLKIQYCYLTS